MEHVSRYLISIERAIDASDAVAKVPMSIGLYAIFVRDISLLPEPMQAYQCTKPTPLLIYIGKERQEWMA